MLFNEPKLLKCARSTLAEGGAKVSVLFNEPKLLKFPCLLRRSTSMMRVSVLFNEPKLLK